MTFPTWASTVNLVISYNTVITDGSFMLGWNNGAQSEAQAETEYITIGTSGLEYPLLLWQDSRSYP